MSGLSVGDLPALGSGGFVLVGLAYQGLSKPGRQLRRTLSQARGRVESFEFYTRRLRRALDDAGVPELPYPEALAYMTGSTPDDDEDGER